ncbi:MAG TPA: ABC transporter substrate-binding protein [Microlunatus sp.]
MDLTYSVAAMTDQHTHRPVRRAAASWRPLLALGVAPLFGLLAACSGGGPDTPSSTPTPSGPAAVSINSQPRNVVAQGGELRLPVTAIGAQWNPLHADADADTLLIMSSLLPQLFNYDANGNPAPNPDYLAGVDASGDNPQVVTYTINPNARWGDGRSIEAADFVANWKACNGQNVSFKCADTKKFAQIASVKQGTDPQQVIVTYRGAFDDWPSTFQYLLPKEAVADPDTFNDGWDSITKINDWLAGPFEVDRTDNKLGVLIETVDPDWWGDPAKLSQLTFRTVAAKDRLADLKANLIDSVDISSDPDQADSVAKIAGCEVRTATVAGQKPELVATRATLANYGAFGRSTVDWTDVGYLPPSG